MLSQLFFRLLFYSNENISLVLATLPGSVKYWVYLGLYHTQYKFLGSLHDNKNMNGNTTISTLKLPLTCSKSCTKKEEEKNPVSCVIDPGVVYVLS